jgi:KaiC/GvpD/RAD55 family RecA-like ATPase
LEFYTEARFIALTGNVLAGDAGTVHDAAIAHLVATCFPPREVVTAEVGEGPCAEWRGPADDEVLIARMLRSTSAAATFGDRASFADLWTANVPKLSAVYPDGGGRAFDASQADAALAQHLAFWTGKDAARIERLMRRSALAREKWDNHPTYLVHFTITNACRMQREVLQDAEPASPQALAQVPGGAPSFRLVDIGASLSEPDKPQEWWWQEYMPAAHVTLLAGHGGAGKSTLALMLAVAISLGRPFLGQPTRLGKVVYFSAEDPGSMVVKRLRKVLAEFGASLDECADRLVIFDATESDAALFREVGREVGVTAAFHELAGRLNEHGADVVIVDNASETYDANEVNRQQVRGFVRALAGLLRARGGAVLLLAHVDKQTSRGDKRATGSENYSGSTAWHNSVRSRLFLGKTEGGMLALEHQKSNLGPEHASLTLCWPVGGLPGLVDPAALHAAAEQREGDAMRALLPLVGEAYTQGRWVSLLHQGPRAPDKVLGSMRGYPALLRPAAAAGVLRTAKERGLITVEEYQTSGRKRSERCKLTEAGVQFAQGAPSAPSSYPAQLRT